MNKNSFIFLVIAIAILILGLGGYYFLAGKKTNPIACTQEAKICPDGSAVGRTGPNCEFAPCPAIQPQNGCNTNNDCQNGASCLVEGPLIANQPVRKVCVPKGQAIPL